jgi:hypothetical protein
MSDGYLVQFPGAHKAFARTMGDVKLLLEAFIEAPVHAQEEEDCGIWFTEEVLESILERVMYLEIIPLGQQEEIEFPLAAPVNARELFNFTIHIAGDRIKTRIKLKRQYRQLLKK